jgi:hypothetical protein
MSSRPEDVTPTTIWQIVLPAAFFASRGTPIVYFVFTPSHCIRPKPHAPRKTADLFQAAKVNAAESNSFAEPKLLELNETNAGAFVI